MFNTYIASQDETWDHVAYNVYNDSLLFVEIMEANREYSDVITFEGGEELQIPVRTSTTIVTTPFKSDSTITIVPSPFD